MGFGLEGQIVGVVEGDDAGVVHKRGSQPRWVNLFRRRPDVAIEQTVDLLRLTPPVGKSAAC